MVMSFMEKVEPEVKEHPLVREHMVDTPVVFKTSDEIYYAMNTLIQFGISGAPVVDEDGFLTGFLSERDCLKCVALNLYHNSRRAGVVENYMTSREALTTVGPDIGLYKASHLFMQLPYKKLLVVEEGRLVGLIRRSDILKAMVS
ncbi:MAG: CBS domain-containing protein [Acidobacteria bacterium]|nr:MAG: CBS domain-containing protein [Acidobacteriota bacterium]